MNLIGKQFGRLTVVSKAEPYVSQQGNKSSRWKCVCSCGNETLVTTSHLTSGHTKSCGCLSSEIASENGKRKKHGLTFDANGNVTRIYRIWGCMKTRCLNPKSENYHLYGGRGITVCDEWIHDFKSFYDWSIENGYSDDLSIDRINSNGNYEPSNCRWATSKEQTDNRKTSISIDLNGETHTLGDWSKILGIKYQTLYARYKSGKTSEQILLPEI